MENEIRSPLRASRTTIFPRGGTDVVSTVPTLLALRRPVGAVSHQNQTAPVESLNLDESRNQRGH